MEFSPFNFDKYTSFLLPMSRSDNLFEKIKCFSNSTIGQNIMYNL